jgi:hypothetical protein
MFFQPKIETDRSREFTIDPAANPAHFSRHAITATPNAGV